MTSKLQYRDIRNLRKLPTEQLKEILNGMNIELAIFKSGTSALIPTKERGGVKWGLFRQLKKGKARILTILNERHE